MREICFYVLDSLGERDVVRYDRCWLKNGQREQYFVEYNRNTCDWAIEKMRAQATKELEEIALAKELVEEVLLPLPREGAVDSAGYV